MNQTNDIHVPESTARVEAALRALRNGHGILVTDDEDRENEGDLIFPAESLTEVQMAMLIRDCSGIVCLCLPGEKIDSLGLPMMVEDNSCLFRTAFTVSIDAAKGITTGVSARDRLTTVHTAIADGAKPKDLCRPGHIFPLRARDRGVLERAGHTEVAVDLMRLAGLRPYGVLAELTNPDGTMPRGPEIDAFADRHEMPVLSIADVACFREAFPTRRTSWLIL